VTVAGLGLPDSAAADAAVLVLVWGPPAHTPPRYLRGRGGNQSRSPVWAREAESGKATLV